MFTRICRRPPASRRSSAQLERQRKRDIAAFSVNHKPGSTKLHRSSELLLQETSPRAGSVEAKEAEAALATEQKEEMERKKRLHAEAQA